MALIDCPECKGKVSHLAEACPLCGYPLKKKPEQTEEYVLTKGNTYRSSFSTFLRILAFIVWIGGLIVSIMGSQEMEITQYGTKTHFSFLTFVTLFLTYIINGVILYGLAGVAEHVSAIWDIVSSLGLEKRKKENERTPLDHIAPSKARDWICPKCNHRNNSWDENCSFCYEPRK